MIYEEGFRKDRLSGRQTKTASKWGVNIRFTITKNEGFEGEVSISGFGGAYE